MTGAPLWYAIVLLVLIPVTGIAVPFVMGSLCKREGWWVGPANALLIHVPGGLFVWLHLCFFCTSPPGGFYPRWWVLADLLTEGVGYFIFFTLVMFASPYALGYAGTRWYNRRHLPQQEQDPRQHFWNSLLLGYVVLIAGAAYMEQYTTLHDAVEAGDLELTRRRLQFNLLGVGPDNGLVNGMTGESPATQAHPLLPIAVESGDRDMIDLLIEHGASINPVRPLRPEKHPMEFYSWNPLIPAVRHDNRALLDYLIEKGADPSRGIVAALYYDEPGMLAYLYEKGADPSRALDGLYETVDGAVVDHLLSRGADPEALLMPVVVAGGAGMEKLLELGANPNLAVDAAVQTWNPWALEKLLAFGADRDRVQGALRRHRPSSAFIRRAMWEALESTAGVTGNRAAG